MQGLLPPHSQSWGESLFSGPLLGSGWLCPVEFLEPALSAPV